MFAAQLGAMIALWALVVVALFRRREALVRSALARSRGARTLQAVGQLLLSVVCLGLAMLVLAQGGLAHGGFTLWGWAATAVLSAGFLALETTALFPLILNATRTNTVGRVTPDASHASEPLDAPRS